LTERRGATFELTALSLILSSLRRFLHNPDVTELCINRPGTVFIETRSGWQEEPVVALDLNWCTRFAKLVANYSRQRIDASTPLLSAALPTGERVQIVLPPATSSGCVAITIRRPAAQLWSLAELAERGVFRMTRRADAGSNKVEAELLRLLAASQFEAFMRLAVRSRMHHRLWAHGFREDHLYQGAHPGDPA
jgi:type IV secretion system protein VirB11